MSPDFPPILHFSRLNRQPRPDPSNPVTFNSLPFLIFLPIVFSIYWMLKGRLRLQNLLLLGASYFFYGWWDWRFLGLILFSSLVDYFVALAMDRSDSERNRRWLLGISLCTNLGLLGVFKYLGFFVRSFEESFGLPIQSDWVTANIILPVGISFYTFQTLSYTIDVYRRQLKPTEDLISFLAFVSYFPQLVAGPIERAQNLLPQFLEERSFRYEEAADGMRQMLWGMFKKVAVANRCAIYVNLIFGDIESQSGSALLLGLVLFSFQIYADFSGYSDIAIGCSKLFGIQLMQNFAYPYFARDIGEFWRRWHISLSTWFRDYVYIPCGGNRHGTLLSIRNILIVFMVSGLWHGANWTFVIWGLMHGLYFLPGILRKSHRKYGKPTEARPMIPSFAEIRGMLLTFAIVTLSWAMFRADNITQAVQYLGGMLNLSLFSLPQLPSSLSNSSHLMLFFNITVLLAVDWCSQNRRHSLELARFPSFMRWTSYAAVASLIFMCGIYIDPGFIYFQF